MLILKPIASASAINSILRHPAIAPKLRHDAREPGYIDNPAVRYMGVFGDALVGVFTSIDVTRWEVEAHIALLPEVIHDARRLARLYLQAEFARPDRLRVTALVLGTLPTAANFCRRLGFKDEGVRRNACRVDGRVTDVIQLGITHADYLRGAGQ